MDGTGFALLHSFAGSATDGKYPIGSLTLSGSTLYGMAPGDASYVASGHFGTIFKIETDGTGFALLHSFAGGTTDGAEPNGGLTLSGSTLYGGTEYGGASNHGTVFKVNTSGSGFTILHSFTNSDAGDGEYPAGNLTLSGSTLYGTTIYGGENNHGTVFSLDTDGSNFTIRHSFYSYDPGGAMGGCSLMLNGGALYGMTQSAIFKMTTSGSAFMVLHSFSAADHNGATPVGSLTLSGTTLYGATASGGGTSDIYGENGAGTVFKMDTTGIGFALVHSFDFIAVDGWYPQGDLTPGGAKLYGMTVEGGSYGLGIIFSMNTDGTGFTLLHSFAGGTTDGRLPYGSLALGGSVLYGMTSEGGSGYENAGTIFSLNTDGSGYTILHSFSGGLDPGGMIPNGSLTLSGTKLYGMTQHSGAGLGTIFSIDTNGLNFTVLHSFHGGSADSLLPYGSLTLSGTTLYGMTNGLAGSSGGAIFSIQTDGTGFTLLHSFAGGATDGSMPYGSLTLSGSTLYGATFGGGDNGTVFKMNTDGTGFALLHSFSSDGTQGKNPRGSLTLSGSTLYGMTPSGGTGGNGTIFMVNTDGTGFALLHSFSWNRTDGTWPGGSLTLIGTALYGMTSGGGALDYGTVFKSDLQPAMGNLQVTLLPAAAVTAGAKWSVDGGSTWRNSGSISLDVGSYPSTLIFKDVNGWTRPPSQTVAINLNATTSATGTYQQTSFSLTAGYNLISLPFNDSGWSTAENLCSPIAGCQAIWKWDAALQQWSGHIPATPTNNFALVPGGAYLVAVSAPTTVPIPGTTWAAPANSLSMGYGLISLPKSKESLANAEALAGNITSCTAIWKWDNASQTWNGHIPGTPTNNFSIAVGDAYLVYVTAASNWP